MASIDPVPAEAGELNPDTPGICGVADGWLIKREFGVPASGTLFDHGYRIMEHV